jgi:catalase
MPLTTDEELLALSRETIEVFDKVDGGVHPGFRPAHAKGVLMTGTFTPSAEAGLSRRGARVAPSCAGTLLMADFILGDASIATWLAIDAVRLLGRRGLAA